MLPVDAKTVKFVAVEKRNMRAVFAVSVGDEKKLARVFGAANERRWTRADCARDADFTSDANFPAPDHWIRRSPGNHRFL